MPTLPPGGAILRHALHLLFTRAPFLEALANHERGEVTRETPIGMSYLWRPVGIELALKAANHEITLTGRRPGASAAEVIDADLLFDAVPDLNHHALETTVGRFAHVMVHDGPPPLMKEVADNAPARASPEPHQPSTPTTGTQARPPSRSKVKAQVSELRRLGMSQPEVFREAAKLIGASKDQVKAAYRNLKVRRGRPKTR